MSWEIEFTNEFEQWWNSLDAAEQEDIAASVMLLRERGPSLGRPNADVVIGSRYPNLKELRTQHAGRPYRTLFAFDPRRVAILLIGGDKTGNDRWYEEFVPLADKIYEQHLREIGKENRK
ncbi:MAG: type II toxin-antitoxin system RelE/ParE family toxin [Candidatus Sulfotelmatobacter sp.]